MPELRCDSGILFGRLEDDAIEVKCRSRRCGHKVGVVVLHYFDRRTGDLKGTKKFKDPAINKEVRRDDSNTALRSA